MCKAIATKEINKTLQNGIVTPEILGYAAYSVSKRAKNWRDKEREYREMRRENHFFVDKYDNETKAREKKEEYYSIKEHICSMFEPTKIHTLIQSRCDWKTGEYYDVERNFLFYEFGGWCFHQPYNGDIEKLKLPVEQLDEDFETFGDDINNLMSTQMVRKILKGLNNGDYQLKINNISI